MAKQSNIKILTKGIFKENPALVTLLGMCPLLAVTTTIYNGFGLGLATLFVMVMANVTISLLKKIIPSAVRLPCFIVVITSFVTITELLVKAYAPELYAKLGIFLPLIAANCIPMGRAEVFASRNSVFKSLLDGIGMGLGFLLALVLMGTVREALGSGTLFAGTDFMITIPWVHENPMIVFLLPAGGFFALSLIIAALNKIINRPPPLSVGCASCSLNGACASCQTGGAGKEA